jgi:hypothetical protein
VSHLAGYASPTNTAIGKGTSFADQCSEKQNFAGTHVSDWHKSDTTGTRFVPPDNQPKENAASSAKDSGVKDLGKRDVSPLVDSPKSEIAASHIADLMARVQLAGDALSDLEPWQAEMVAAKVLGAAGSPLPSFLGGMDDARFWASLATPIEVEAYGAACFEVMDLARLPDFLSFVQGRAAA